MRSGPSSPRAQVLDVQRVVAEAGGIERVREQVLPSSESSKTPRSEELLLRARAGSGRGSPPRAPPCCRAAAAVHLVLLALLGARVVVGSRRQRTGGVSSVSLDAADESRGRAAPASGLSGLHHRGRCRRSRRAGARAPRASPSRAARRSRRCASRRAARCASSCAARPAARAAARAARRPPCGCASCWARRRRAPRARSSSSEAEQSAVASRPVSRSRC